jgi:molybdopterin-guanine dinucleotide biosynthesis protein A
MTAAIVLAGGRSTRYGSDKLAAPLADGRSVLAHSLAAVGAAASEVVLVLAPGAPRPTGLAEAVVVVHDPEAFGGPLVGLLAGLEAVVDEVVLVVGGDMPAAESAVLRLLVATVRGDPTVEAARLEVGPAAGASVGTGRPAAPDVMPLPCAVRREAAVRACRDALVTGDRRLRGCLERLATVVVAAGEWRALDPTGRTLLDIDDPSDLARLSEPR